jgi:hypothetical protein
VVCWEALLLLVTGSGTPALTLAELVIVPTLFGTSTIVTVADMAVLNVPRLQVIVLVPLQDPWLEVTDTKVMPGGSVSLRDTFVAVAGPSLWTVI